MTSPLHDSLEQLRVTLGARQRQRLVLEGYRASAVLVPLVIEPGASEPSARLIFTVRHADLRAHAGQISFPGGKRDDRDQGAAATAIRETEEELGIPGDRIEVLGELDDVPTPSGFVITPVVGRIAGPVALTPSAGEVAEVFAAEVEALRHPEVHTVGGAREWLGIRYEMHEYRYGNFRIWGATARIVWQLLDLLPPRPTAALGTLAPMPCPVEER